MCACVCVRACSYVHTWAPACMFTRSDVGYPWSSLKGPTEQGNTEQGVLLEPWTIGLPSLPSTKALLWSVSYFGYLFPISFGKGFSLPQKQFSIAGYLGEKEQRMRCGEQKACLWDPGLCNCHHWALISSSPDWFGGAGFGVLHRGTVGIRCPSCLPHWVWPVDPLVLDRALLFARGCPEDRSVGISELAHRLPFICSRRKAMI